MFLFKKIVSQFFFPLTFSLMVCYFGLFLLFLSIRREKNSSCPAEGDGAETEHKFNSSAHNKYQRWGFSLITIGLLLLTSFAYEPVCNLLLSPLENAYPAFDQESVESSNPDFDPKYIVVLGGGHSGDSSDNPLNRLSDASARRLMEGIRLSILYPKAKLLLSGGNAYGPQSNAEIMSLTAESLRVAKKKILQEDQSLDTKDQAHLVKEIVGTNQFLLVTSASHMPRSMALFASLGMDAIPAVTRTLSLNSRFSPGNLFPSEFEIYKSRRAVYEYLGLLWGKLNQQI